ncbi:OmpA family protein [Thalassobaculum sp. OXR-137]|uniref:OmpA family protein n=1 Tax=Thalassobaculum sp. OXR-137 TaxID=3100173 RepID=UPI002AC960FB|nr:OmpA family protein [Thalassobaculum sp. OXR-137]WPZ35886.1 OmpA family protein [Thalassobaculum sp. OXR-137]
MKMIYSKYAFPLIGVALLLSQPAAADPFFGQVDEVKSSSFTGEGFDQHLAANYRELVIFEVDEMYDWFDGRDYADKAQAAAAGARVMPDDLEDRNIADPNALTDLRTQHTRLLAALNGGAIQKAPVQIARAQAKFDCWAEQQEEGWQTWDIAACRDAYMAAMGEVDAAMAPKVAAGPSAPLPVSPFPVDGYMVFFDFDRSAITPQAAAILDRVAIAALEQKAQLVELTAYTDRAGSIAYNQLLSERRGDAVRAYLGGRGVVVGHITTLGMGEANSRVATADDVREPENRRVTVYLR